MSFLWCNLLNVSFSLPFFKFEKPSPLNSTDISDINHLQQGLVYHHCERMAGFQRDEHCLDQSGALGKKKEAKWTHLFIQSSLCPIIQPLRFFTNMGRKEPNLSSIHIFCIFKKKLVFALFLPPEFSAKGGFIRSFMFYNFTALSKLNLCGSTQKKDH